MFINSLKLGTESTFHMAGQEVGSIWVLNPFKNLFVVFRTCSKTTVIF